ncbi:hypothetical protein ACFQ40_15325 [Kroppenstedtia eburnea]|uniref:hypothetical protein n=1 Tax=Kroppenstedtia eburnea TaxID=714067 RepID=UPI003639A4F5
MLTTDVLPVGSFLIPVKWLALWAWIAVGGKVATLLEKDFVGKKVKWTEPFVQAALLWYILWRWSPVLWDPLSFVNHPLSLLYMSGTEKGWWLAWLSAAGFLVWVARKSGAGYRRLLDAAAVTALVAGAGLSLLFVRLGAPTTLPWGVSPEGYQQIYHPIHFYRAAVLAAVGVWMWRGRGRLREGESFARIVTAAGVGLLIISYFDYYPVTRWWALSGEQWAFAGVALTGWVAGWWNGRKEAPYLGGSQATSSKTSVPGRKVK